MLQYQIIPTKGKTSSKRSFSDHRFIKWYLSKTDWQCIAAIFLAVAMSGWRIYAVRDWGYWNIILGLVVALTICQIAAFVLPKTVNGLNARYKKYVSILCTAFIIFTPFAVLLPGKAILYAIGYQVSSIKWSTKPDLSENDAVHEEKVAADTQNHFPGRSAFITFKMIPYAKVYEVPPDGNPRFLFESHYLKSWKVEPGKHVFRFRYFGKIMDVPVTVEDSMQYTLRINMKTGNHSISKQSNER